MTRRGHEAEGGFWAFLWFSLAPEKSRMLGYAAVRRGTPRYTLGHAPGVEILILQITRGVEMVGLSLSNVASRPVFPPCTNKQTLFASAPPEARPP